MANRNQERDTQRGGANEGGSARRAGSAGYEQTERAGGTGAASPDRARSVETTRESPGQGGVSRRGPRGGGAAIGYLPLGLMGRMMADMDRMFSGFGIGPTRGRGQNGDDTMQSMWAPEIELFRRNNDLIVRADLPGLKKDDVNIEIEHDVLTISGERHHEFEEETDGVYRSERSYGSFYRAIPLPDGTDPDDVKARFEDGVLEIRLKLPKEREGKSKRIQIR